MVASRRTFQELADRTRLLGAAVLVLLVMECSSCGGKHERSYSQGINLVTDGAAATVAHLSPKPALAVPSDRSNEGICMGLSGDSHGTISIVKYYRLGAVSTATSDRWFDQAKNWWVAQGYPVNHVEGQRGSRLRRMGTEAPYNRVSFLLQRGYSDDEVELIVESPCVSDSPPPRVN